MYSSLASSSPSVTDEWSSYDIEMWQRAGLEIRNALESGEIASAMAAPLPDDTAWQARGVRALHEAIAKYNARLVLEVMVLRSHVDDWQAVGVA